MSKEKAGRGGNKVNLACVSAGLPQSGVASRGPSSQSSPGQTVGNICISAAWTAVEAVTNWSGTPIPLRASGCSSLLAKEFAHPWTRTWQTHGTHSDRGNKSPATLKLAMLTLEGNQRGKGQAMPFGMQVGNALQHFSCRKSRGAWEVSQKQSLPSCLLF